MPRTTQNGVSPKLLADLIVSIVIFAAAYFGVELDPALSAAIGKAAGFIAGAIVGPGDVSVQTVGPASDDKLMRTAAVRQRLAESDKEIA